MSMEKINYEILGLFIVTHADEDLLKMIIEHIEKTESNSKNVSWNLDVSQSYLDEQLTLWKKRCELSLIIHGK